MGAAIDWKLCLELVNNKEDVARELLEMFVSELPETNNKLHEAYSNKNLADLEDIVHKLHGGSCYCGVPQLKTAAAELEKFLKTKWPEANSPDLAKRYTQLVAEINHVMESYEQEFAQL